MAHLALAAAAMAARPAGTLGGSCSPFPIDAVFGCLQVACMQAITKLAVLGVICVSFSGPGQATEPADSLSLWQHGSLRGANVMLAQCTVEDLRVLRSWGANLAEIPVLNVYGPRPPYGFQPENLAKLDQAVQAAEQAHLYVALTCREGPGRPDFNRSHEIWRDAAAQEAYAKMWREIASHYRGRVSIVGYDLETGMPSQRKSRPRFVRLTRKPPS